MMAIAIFLLWYIWICIVDMVVREPPLFVVKLVSHIVAFVLILIVTFGLPNF